MNKTNEYTNCVQKYSEKFTDYTSKFWNVAYPVKMGSVDFTNTDDYYFVKMDVPGMSIDDIDINVYNGNILTISGERILENNENHNSTYLERSHGKFSRSFELKGDEDLDNMGADLLEGVLTIEIPRIPIRTLNIPIVNRY